MPSLNGQISFTVKFDLTGFPSLVLQASTTIPSINKPSLSGYFYIQQPDKIERTGSYVSADVVWNGTGYNPFVIPLRLGADQLYQRGDYVVSFFADADGYTPGEITRAFSMQYLPVKQILVPNFDCFLPQLTYNDATNYGVGDYSITTQTNAWAATSTAGNPTGNAALFDLVIGGFYYDCLYAINYVKNISYQNDADTWLSVSDRFINNISIASFIPATLAFLLTYLIAIKDKRDAAANCQGDYNTLDELFEDADTLYQYMRSRVCAQNTANLAKTFDEYYRITHNYQPQVYVNTNNKIPAYDFTTGCQGSGPAAGITVLIQCVIGNTPVVVGTLAAVSGLTGGSGAITSAAFAGVNLEIVRGTQPVPSIDPLDGSYFFTKVLASSTITLSAPLAPGEFIKIKTIPN